MQSQSQLTVRRLSVATQTPFDQFIGKFEAQLGEHRPEEFREFITGSSQAEKVKGILDAQAGSSGFLLFATFPLGGLLTLIDRPTKAIQYIIGHPFDALALLRQDIRIGLSVPLRLFVYADSQDCAVVEYDEPSSIFAALGNAENDPVAQKLNGQLAHLIQSSSI